MNASDTCLSAIKGWEGCELSVYSDLNGFPTIGYGHKLTHSDIVSGKFSSPITEDQADTLFDQDVAPFETQVNGLGLTLTQGQFDALFDFDYNLGINNLKVMLSHGIDQVPQQLPRWVHAAGVVESGLVTRRNTEIQWWNS
jgi:lysozyme